MSFPKRTGATLVALALLGGALALLTSDPEEASLERDSSAWSSAISSAQAEAAPQETSTVALEEQVRVRIDSAQTQSRLGRIAQRALDLSRRPSLDAVLASAKARGGGDLLSDLESHLRRYPDDAAALLTRMRAERGPTAFFLMARALSRSLGDPVLRRQTIRLLRSLDPRRRGDGLVALLGRRDVETTAFLIGLLERDRSPLVRQRAASVLAGVMKSLAPANAQRARWVARRWLSAPTPSARARIAAATLLGQPGASAADMRLLRRELDRSRDAESVSALTHGLCLAGMRPPEVRAALSGLLERRSTPSALKGTIRKMLAALAGAPS